MPFNNLIADSKVQEVVAVDFAAHAAAMGCEAETVTSDRRSWRRRSAGRAAPDRTYVIAIKTSAYDWTGGRLVLGGRGARRSATGAEIRAARAAMDAGKAAQRVGW